MSMQMMQVPTTTTAATSTTLPSFAAAAVMAHNPGMTTGEGGLDGSDGAAVGKLKGQNVADGDYDDGVVVKVGLKFGRNAAVVWGGGNRKTSTKTKTPMPSSSSSVAAGSAQYDEHDEHDDEYGEKHHHEGVVVVGSPGLSSSPGINVVNLARSNTITDNTTMEKTKENKEDEPAVKNTVLLRGSSKPLACCVM